MRNERTQQTLISASITIIALIALSSHIMNPAMMIDNMTVWLFVIAVVPWFVPLLKGVRLGSLELELWERLRKVETDTGKTERDYGSDTRRHDARCDTCV